MATTLCPAVRSLRRSAVVSLAAKLVWGGTRPRQGPSLSLEAIGRRRHQTARLRWDGLTPCPPPEEQTGGEIRRFVARWLIRRFTMSNCQKRAVAHRKPARMRLQAG